MVMLRVFSQFLTKQFQTSDNFLLDEDGEAGEAIENKFSYPANLRYEGSVCEYS